MAERHLLASHEMREIPECLHRRYRALDELIKDLTAPPPEGVTREHPSCENNEIGIKLMCDFWNILENDPDCNLQQEVRQRLGVEGRNCCTYGPSRLDCYTAGRDKDTDRRREAAMSRVKYICVAKEDPRISKRYGCETNCDTDKINDKINDKMPLSQVLCNLKEAASVDKKCTVRVGELILAQQELTEQIQVLEEREKQGVMLLKQADCMWSCMEEAYKKKVANVNERYNILLKELREVEISATKWRKHKKDLEFQLTNIKQCEQDIKDKLHQKMNDVKVMDIEIEDLNKRIASNNKDLDTAKNSYKSTKEASDARMASIAVEMVKLQRKVESEYKSKADKEQEGTNYIKEARDDLQKICRVLLQKKLENEDLRAEKNALIQEINLLRNTCDTCKDRCANREQSIADEIKRVEAELRAFRAKCVKCHQCTDTIDVRKYCTECPRCIAERDCLYEDDHCSPDHTMDCVCMSVKQKFLDNVFDNMYTVLERQSKTCPGRAVADCVLNCLKRSRNGKLNEDTRKVLQEFILSTVKKNLNLTIVGGAVKTRCEMDQETYKELMLCLKDVAVTRPVKEDKGTAAKKEPCRRWGGTKECNCPKGPKACICTKKAPPPPTDPTSCGPPQSEETDTSERTCPRREPLACSTDCGMLGLPGAAEWKREPCAGQTCPFSKNMHAAQCVLGPEAAASAPKNMRTAQLLGSEAAASAPKKMRAALLLGSEAAASAPKKMRAAQLLGSEAAASAPKNMRAAQLLGSEAAASAPKTHTTPPIIPIPNLPKENKMATCDCGGKAVKPAHKDRRIHPRHRIIEEVMGRYTDVSPIEKVPKVADHKCGITSTRRIDLECDCSNLPIKYLLTSKTSENKINRYCACSSNYVSRGSRKPFLKKLRKKGHIHICRNSKSDNDANVVENLTLFADVGLKTAQRNTNLRNKSDNDIKIILCPKFPHSCDDKKVISLGNMKVLESAHVRLKHKSSSKMDQKLDSYDAGLVERKVCDTVKELMKDILVPQIPPSTNLSSSDVEWVTLGSFYKEISSLTKSEGLSRDTVNEVEVKCETLEASKDFKLLNKNINEVESMSLHNNIIGIRQNNSMNENESSDYTNDNDGLSESIYKNGEHINTITEELKLQLLDDIRQTYNISVETSLEKVKELDFNAGKLKNIRKCLRNLEETVKERNKCSCINTQRQRHDDRKNNPKNTKKNVFFEKKNEKNVKNSEIKKCLVATADIPDDKFEKSENKVMFKNQAGNKLDFLKRNKNKKNPKKSK